MSTALVPFISSEILQMVVSEDVLSLINVLMLTLLFSAAVPENILKKQARDAKLLQTQKKTREDAKKARAEARKAALANAEKYYKEYEAADAALVKAKRDAKEKGTFFVEAEPKVALLVRIRG